MPSPRFVDPYTGAPAPTRPCLRCGAAMPIYDMKLEDVRRGGWQLFVPTKRVNWCGHGQELLPLPGPDGWCRLVPILGEAR